MWFELAKSIVRQHMHHERRTAMRKNYRVSELVGPLTWQKQMDALNAHSKHDYRTGDVLAYLLLTLLVGGLLVWGW